jgi:tetratricopeptide (TPR) repeat protein
LAANDEAQHYFERAAELSDDPLVEAQLHERAAVTAWVSGRMDEARAHLEHALTLFEDAGQTHPAARVSARLGEVQWRAGQLDQALERMEKAFQVLAADEPDADLATLAAQLGRLHFFKGEIDRAAERIDTAIEVAESLWLPEILSQALNTQGLIASFNGRSEQSLALFKHALELALEHDLGAAALRAYNNIADQLERRDRYEDAIELSRRGLGLARKTGDRTMEWYLLGELGICLLRTGRWDEALEVAGEVPEHGYAEFGLGVGTTQIEIAVARGDVAEGQRVLSLLAHYRTSADVQDRSAYYVLDATLSRATGRYEEALAASEEALASLELLGFGISGDAKVSLGEGLESALELGRLDKVEELLARIDAIPIGKRPPLLRAQSARFRARLAAAKELTEGVEQGFRTAAATFREYSLTFFVGATELEHADWLVGQGRAEDARPLLDEAREIFERLEAAPWLARCDALAPARVETASV